MVFELNERFSCPLCGSTASEELQHLPFSQEQIARFLRGMFGQSFAGEYVLQRCRKCLFTWQRFCLTDRFYEYLYESELWNRRPSATPNCNFGKLWFEAGKLKLLKEMAGKDTRELCLLDFGCGWGDTACLASAFGFRVTACENDPGCNLHVRKRGIKAITSLGEIAEESQDIIYCHQVMEHVSDPASIMKELIPLLRPGGKAYFSMPDIGFMKGDFSPASIVCNSAAAPLTHINCFTRKRFVRLAEEMGLRECCQLKVRWAQARMLLKRKLHYLFRKPSYGLSFYAFFEKPE